MLINIFMFTDAWLYYSIGVMIEFVIVVPLFLTMLIVAIVKKEYKKNKSVFYTILAGIICVLVILILHVFGSQYFENNLMNQDVSNDFVVAKFTFFAFLVLIMSTPFIIGYWIRSYSQNKK